MTRRRHNDSFYESVVRLRQARPADTQGWRENLRIAAELTVQVLIAIYVAVGVVALLLILAFVVDR